MSRPTFGTGPSTVEAHLVGIDRDLYGRQVCIVFLARIREELPFPDRESLKIQIRRDVDRTIEVFERTGAGKRQPVKE